MLRELDLKLHYSTGQDSLLDDFYVPCLKNAARYDRTTGYFSSALYAVTSAAYSDFIAGGGRIRLITSPELSPGDVDAIAEGATASKQGQEALRAELARLLEHPETAGPTRLLATMVASGVLHLRVAIQPGQGIFHDKVGVFEDDEGRRVGFIGSANETFRGWGANHESIEVFTSWSGSAELARVRRMSADFERLWNGGDGTVEVMPLDDETLQILRDHAHPSVDAALAAQARAEQTSSDRKTLMDHQIAVLQSWADAGYHGIVSFATGAGKTLTAIEGIRRWTARTGNAAVVVVPSTELHHQWAREIKTELPEANLALAGAGHNDWKPILRWFLSDHAHEGRPRVVLATNQTFSSPDFLDGLRASRASTLLVADEMHRTGSRVVIEALEVGEFAATLGLSATYARQFDEAGTQRLVAIYGSVLEPVIGLTEAILLGRLVPYDYHLHVTTLDHVEAEKYGVLTDKIRRLAGRNNQDANPDDSYIRALLIQRARILKKAASKVPIGLEILEREYSEGDRWLVYCDDTAQLRQMVEGCLERDLPALEFHSTMDAYRTDVMESFKRRGGILVAIKCLDEGVDIPACDKALILASSTVEREYIQRRGRVLRTSPGKHSAAVHDLLLVDAEGGVLTRGEALRAIEFARLARNADPTIQLQHLLALSTDFSSEVSHLLEGSLDD